MGREHDELVMKATNKDFIKKLLRKYPEYLNYLGEKNKWASREIHEFLDNETIDAKNIKCNDLKDQELLNNLYNIGGNEKVRKYIRMNIKSLDEYEKEDFLEIKSTKEFHLSKGQGIYFKSCDFFIDAIIDISIFRCYLMHAFKTYAHPPTQLLIECKTQIELNDLGSILRQIKKYNQWYLNGNHWKDGGIKQWILLVKYKPSEELKSFFESENIKVISVEEIEGGRTLNDF